MVMRYLVEKNLPFSCQVMTGSSNFKTEPMNHLVFALLECFGENVGLPQSGVETGSDIERLEHKLNLVLFMLNNLIQPNLSRPAVQLLRLGTDSVSWQTSVSLNSGQTVLLELFLHPMLSLPLQCCAEVIELEEGWCTASLTGLTEQDKTVWSRWVFRQHRHFVAHSREVG